MISSLRTIGFFALFALLAALSVALMWALALHPVLGLLLALVAVTFLSVRFPRRR